MSADGHRRYDSPRRREQAGATRAAIAEAARHLFAERGWAATTVRDIARAARVSEPTVYNAYGGKAGLAIALVDALDSGAEAQRMMGELSAADDDPAAQLAALVGFDCRLYAHDGDVIAMMREAGRVEPDLAAAYREGRRRGRKNQRRVFSSWPASALRPGVDVDSACDSYAALCHIDSFRALTGDEGWSADRVEAWWRDALVRLILR
jgi:AcrR family transcriptional regulator